MCVCVYFNYWGKTHNETVLQLIGVSQKWEKTGESTIACISLLGRCYLSKSYPNPKFQMLQRKKTRWWNFDLLTENLVLLNWSIYPTDIAELNLNSSEQ